jgi:hypothetical protein
LYWHQHAPDLIAEYQKKFYNEASKCPQIYIIKRILITSGAGFQVLISVKGYAMKIMNIFAWIIFTPATKPISDIYQAITDLNLFVMTSSTPSI